MSDVNRAPAEQLIDALAQQDFARLGGCFRQGCRLRAFTPNNVLGTFGPEGVVVTYRNWFGDAEQLALVEHSVDAVSDRLRVRYLLDVTENGERGLCEQVAYIEVVDNEIADLTLICSGTRPFVEAGG